MKGKKLCVIPSQKSSFTTEIFYFQRKYWRAADERNFNETLNVVENGTELLSENTFSFFEPYNTKAYYGNGNLNENSFVISVVAEFYYFVNFEIILILGEIYCSA